MVRWKNFKPTRITKFEFIIKGDSKKNISKVITDLKKLKIGNIHVQTGKLVIKKEIEFEEDFGSTIYSTNIGKFIGVKTGHVYSGEHVSEMK